MSFALSALGLSALQVVQRYAMPYPMIDCCVPRAFCISGTRIGTRLRLAHCAQLSGKRVHVFPHPPHVMWMASPSRRPRRSVREPHERQCMSRGSPVVIYREP